MTSRQDWLRRFYGERQHRPMDRAQEFHHVISVAADMVELGVMLYDDLHVASHDWFDGTADSILAAVRRGDLPRPHRPLPRTQIGWALTCYAGHTGSNLDAWVEQARVVTITSYVQYLRATCKVRPMRERKPPPYLRDKPSL